jgi:AcrR family transcriptional regulator
MFLARGNILRQYASVEKFSEGLSMPQRNKTPAARNGGPGKGSSEGSPRLSRDDWIQAAYRTLSESGWKTLNVEALAKRLGVTKGSFYWHFKDRDALLAAVLERWNEQLVISRTEATGGSPAEKIRYMLDIVVNAGQPGRRGSLELAMRSWARQNRDVAQVVEAVDQRRLDYTAGLFRQAGFAAREADARAMLLFSYIFSQGILSFTDGRVVQDDLHSLCRSLIEGEPPRAAAE